ncbi:ABC transporter permease [Oribacterium sp. oral taxon 102]|uniref:ABC transporter permease n=1 Tax=Oribacterium sp. oral taxon 102 TaxID=671214 RepID=UPI0015BB94E2|nr:ABC transporter permease [Oribacterium sp. oral taxon 102]NWO21144.1 ABC transporter permease [Oribacterium sp. oral taxon 102]
MNNLINLLARAFFMSTPLVLGALGEVIAERTGMMVTAVEGIFLIGAWGGFIGAYISGSIWGGFLLAMLCGLMVALLYGLTTIYMNQHQIVMGTAISILITGFCTFFYRVIFGIQTTPLKVEVLPLIEIPVLSKLPLLGDIIFSQNLITYITYIMVPIIFFVVFKTSLGLTLRSCGENPEAVDAAGINVRMARFGAVAVAGCLGGISGAYYSLCNVGMYTSEIISGRGWIAFGICFLGNWNPVGALLFGIVFGISEAIGVYVKALGMSVIPSELFSALPYMLVIILTVCRKQLKVPNKLGVKYIKEN